MIVLGAYAVFLILATAMIAKLGFVLKRHGDLNLDGRTDRRDAVETADDRRLQSINRLTLLGFGLVSVGAVALLLRLGVGPGTMTGAPAFLATRLGILLVVLGVAHFQCLSVMARAAQMPFESRRGRPIGLERPRRAKEDPLDRVFEAARLDAPFGG